MQTKASAKTVLADSFYMVESRLYANLTAGGLAPANKLGAPNGVLTFATDSNAVPPPDYCEVVSPLLSLSGLPSSSPLTCSRRRSRSLARPSIRFSQETARRTSSRYARRTVGRPSSCSTLSMARIRRRRSTLAPARTLPSRSSNVVTGDVVITL